MKPSSGSLDRLPGAIRRPVTCDGRVTESPPHGLTQSLTAPQASSGKQDSHGPVQAALACTAELTYRLAHIEVRVIQIPRRFRPLPGSDRSHGPTGPCSLVATE